MTTSEVADYYGVTVKTIYEWIAKDQIPEEARFRTLGGHWRFWRNKLER